MKKLQQFNFPQNVTSPANPATSRLPPFALSAIPQVITWPQKCFFFPQNVYPIAETVTFKTTIYVSNALVLVLSVLDLLHPALIAIVTPQINFYTMHHAKPHVQLFITMILHKFHIFAFLVSVPAQLALLVMLVTLVLMDTTSFHMKIHVF